MTCKLSYLSTFKQHHHNHLPKPQHTQHSPQPHSPPNATHAKSKRKSVGESGQKFLSNLVKEGGIDITDTSFKTIKAVWQEYFAHCVSKNFHCNFAISKPL